MLEPTGILPSTHPRDTAERLPPECLALPLHLIPTKILTLSCSPKPHDLTLFLTLTPWGQIHSPLSSEDRHSFMYSPDHNPHAPTHPRAMRRPAVVFQTSLGLKSRPMFKEALCHPGIKWQHNETTFW